MAFETNRSNRRDRNRRRRWLTSVHRSNVSRGCRAWLMCISERSSDTAKPVWGMQIKQAKEIGCSDRQVRRYRVEAEKAKLIETRHGAFERRPDGTCGRTSTNLYVFNVPPGAPKRRKPSSHRQDAIDRSNHQSTIDYVTLRRTPKEFPPLDETVPWSCPPPMGFKALKARIGR